MKRTKQQRLDTIKSNKALIEASGFGLHYFSDIHVRIDSRVDFWLSTSNWHIKGKKKEGKSIDEMFNYLKGGILAPKSWIGNRVDAKCHLISEINDGDTIIIVYKFWRKYKKRWQYECEAKYILERLEWGDR